MHVSQLKRRRLKYSSPKWIYNDNLTRFEFASSHIVYIYIYMLHKKKNSNKKYSSLSYRYFLSHIFVFYVNPSINKWNLSIYLSIYLSISFNKQEEFFSKMQIFFRIISIIVNSLLRNYLTAKIILILQRIFVLKPFEIAANQTEWSGFEQRSVIKSFFVWIV